MSDIIVGEIQTTTGNEYIGLGQTFSLVIGQLRDVQRVVANFSNVHRLWHSFNTRRRIKRPYYNWTWLQICIFRKAKWMHHFDEGFTAVRMKTNCDHTSISQSSLWLYKWNNNSYNTRTYALTGHIIHIEVSVPFLL